MKMASIFLLIATLGTATVVQAADITGIITFKGTPPAEKEITPLMDDANCSALHTKMPTTRFYVVGAKGELADVVVSLKGITGKSTGRERVASGARSERLPLYAHDFGDSNRTKAGRQNSDPCVHNVHAVPSASSGNPGFNDGQQPGSADLTYTFPKPEMFLKYQCDVHPWMFAWVSIFDHPYFSVSDADGKFTIKNVPPGKYTVEAAHRKLGTQNGGGSKSRTAM
ncbi:MAG: hypothetical protein WDM76_12895 [Limisphaerales bacterium]